MPIGPIQGLALLRSKAQDKVSLCPLKMMGSTSEIEP